MDICIYMSESLPVHLKISENITTLLNSYTPIQNKMFQRKKKKDYKETLVIFSIFTSKILFLSSLKGMPKFSALPLYMFYWF